MHLVIEYMDGGSLQDIVDRGGCRDENVLADISYQVGDTDLVTDIEIMIELVPSYRDLMVGNGWITVFAQSKAYSSRYQTGKYFIE